MFPAATKEGGMCIAEAPDVCLVPAAPAPIPTPFPNMAQCAMANGATCTTTVKLMNMPALLANTEIPMSLGDDAGVGGGVVSGTFGQAVMIVMGSATVMFDGKPAALLMSTATHNGTSPNAPLGMLSVPSQMLLMISP